MGEWLREHWNGNNRAGAPGSFLERRSVGKILREIDEFADLGPKYAIVQAKIPGKTSAQLDTVAQLVDLVREVNDEQTVVTPAIT